MSLRITCLVVLLAGTTVAFAGDHAYQYGVCGHCGGKICCPQAKLEKETRYCWEVECEEVCIPAVRLPWMKCCHPRCGRVRTVNVLTRREYEVERCDYPWTIYSLCGPRCEKCRATGADSVLAPQPAGSPLALPVPPAPAAEEPAPELDGPGDARLFAPPPIGGHSR